MLEIRATDMLESNLDLFEINGFDRNLSLFQLQKRCLHDEITN